MTRNHFGHGEKHLDEVVLAFGGVSSDADPGKDRQAEADGGAVQDRSIAFDRTGFFQQFDPSRTRRRRQTHPFGQNVVRQSGVSLKFAQDFQVYRIKLFGIGRIDHDSQE